MKRRTLISLAFALLPLHAGASRMPTMPLDEMTAQADHILIGHTVGFDMVDQSGNELFYEGAKTGPGEGNRIRLHVAVDKVLAGNGWPAPTILKLPLSGSLHLRLSDFNPREMGMAGPFLVLLKGPQYEPIRPGLFMLHLAQQDEALRLHALSHP